MSFLFENLNAQDLSQRKRHFPITSIRVETGAGSHDRITVWNRGGNAGTLTVVAGDGMSIADLLTHDDCHWRLTPEHPAKHATQEEGQ